MVLCGFDFVSRELSKFALESLDKHRNNSFEIVSVDWDLVNVNPGPGNHYESVDWIRHFERNIERLKLRYHTLPAAVVTRFTVTLTTV